MSSEDLFEKFKNKKIVVLGDLMIDAYLSGKVNRISPEAPVPIINNLKHENRLGGAGNVALNLRSLGAEVIMCTVLGKDKEADLLIDLLKKEGISTAGIIQLESRITTVKTRVIGNNQQLVRIDQEQIDDLNSQEGAILVEKLAVILEKGVDAIIFQDYNKGILTSFTIEKAIALAKKHQVITTVDPKLKNFFAYNGVTLFKPNLKELQEGLNISIDFAHHRERFEAAIGKLNSKLSSEIVFVTLSEYGVYIEQGDNKHYIAAHQRNISDVSGAGDTVISVATLCLTIGLSIEKVAAFANLAGGIVCEYRGVVAIQAEQLKEEVKRLNLL